MGLTIQYCKTRFFVCPLFREPGKFAKITGRETFNTVAFQCSRKQKRQNYGVQNNYIDSNAKIKGFTVFDHICLVINSLSDLVKFPQTGCCAANKLSK